MSIEQLLFFLLLIALPLLERLIRAMRMRANDSSAERAATVAGPAVSGSRPTGSPDDASGTAADGRQTELTLPALRREGNRGPIARLRAGGRSDSRSALSPVIVDGDLRRAIVMIAILGPCRALEPKDASQLGQ